ncbi:type II toxin-antitoxin system prevent-host-death family antitoxin [Aurantimonas sp. C2-6-R+9]|uniref:type II toxin-antitoxin system Phd/YefM family antitoxin n=1 Tax=unclassified Aurantimonas TaxID=2638230 RepID=UPI002E195A1C|nr:MULTISPECIES: type II toxin-antitoxin system prevent-host-death family antitoxin [unclassified Aurantimonas]MEC5292453.1 type II toxin-antitoxin system prevent-host-death family antitoxin [Aurantimonas sp. C2-3-R2]MEC5324967.1 type II toxin-antitoxin system prevent-host-death family antitoxin [Aurantimonas sp. A3-2-R12]MEC5382611.1 type II toxin-antitoxin system prevent-host-death family antitoxin [Aurantimonas sp. C2-6-R+9]MEC5413615.1 type II toxin-antitoxin system prevent-host-death famil
MQKLSADLAVSVSDLKRSPSAVLNQAGGIPVAILNHNKVMAYMVPAAFYERLVEQLDDMALAEIARTRADEVPVSVDLNDL